MRCSPAVLLALPAIASAQQQRPLFESVQDTVQGWLGTAQSYIPSSFEDVTAPFQAGAAKAAEHNVVPLTMQNWRETLTPSNSKASEGPEEWMVFVTGGNKTCFGFCEQVETAWNVLGPLRESFLLLLWLTRVLEIRCASFRDSAPTQSGLPELR